MAKDSVPAAGVTGLAGSALSDPLEWVSRHGDYLYRYALLRVRDPVAAEDLVQDTFLAALKGRERYPGKTPERAWFTGILRHKILDHFRQQSRKPMGLAADGLPEELEARFDDRGAWKRHPPLGPADWGPDPATLMERKEFMGVLSQCLGKLPRRCAEVFILREMEATESGVIQEELGISPSNCWVLLHRARMQLRLCLEQNWLKL